MALDDPIKAMNRRLSHFFPTAVWLKKAGVEVGRICIYAALVGTLMLAGWLLRETISPMFSIAGFAAAVFLIAVILPVVKLQLHGRLVDKATKVMFS